jgi:hypothetical protein
MFLRVMSNFAECRLATGMSRFATAIRKMTLRAFSGWVERGGGGRRYIFWFSQFVA